MMLSMLVLRKTVLLTVTICACAVAAEDQPANPICSVNGTGIRFRSLPLFRMPRSTRTVLANGTRVVLLQENDLPRVGIAVYIKAGAHFEPPDRRGLARVLATALSDGGTSARSGDQLRKELNQSGASLKIAFDDTLLNVSVLGPTRNWPATIRLLAELISSPDLSRPVVEEAKAKTKLWFKRREQDPQATYMDEAFTIIDEGAPHDASSKYDALSTITPADVLSFYKQRIEAEPLSVGIWGDIDSSTRVLSLLNETIGRIPKATHSPNPFAPSAAAVDSSRIYRIDRSDMGQAWVGYFRPSVTMRDPDYFPLAVADSILGTGTSSRVFNKVRTQLGLAYLTGTLFVPHYDYPGVLGVAAGTKTNTAERTLHVIRDLMLDFSANGVSTEELQRAQAAILGRTAADIDSLRKSTFTLLTYTTYPVPSRYFMDFQNNIRRVTVKDVNRVAKLWFTPSDFKIIVMGNIKEIHIDPGT
jgi:zinc protease